ncbi:serine/threonine-protein kinase pim-1-like [Bombina bombina]|uniref:serine/threonine-protein kinase pim-1-like n=1 Tax=Bombina bombina TaxID=8345 RepID=UPI00235A8264|nr:serine/threonine-protein kinase pim-1-like [Bombina bombina]
MRNFRDSDSKVSDPLIASLVALPYLSDEEDKEVAAEGEISVLDITKPIDRFYQVGSPIMSGGFGTVFSGERKSDNFPVAVKYVPKDRVERMKFVNGALIPMEIYLMQKVSTGFQGVINLLDWYEQDDSFAMVMERPEQVQDLFDYITEHRALREDVAAKFFSQVVNAVIHCHNCGVLHNDIKDENILVDLATNQTKLIDFGSATLLHDQAYTELEGTYEYLPPEWFCFHRFHGRSAAVWTLGILLYDMLCGNVPFANQEEIVKGKIKYPIGISKGCQDMIRWCLSKKPADRPTLEQILSHPWVSQNQLDTIKEENEPEQVITNQRNENL